MDSLPVVVGLTVSLKVRVELLQTHNRAKVVHIPYQHQVSIEYLNQGVLFLWPLAFAGLALLRLRRY